MASVDDLAKLLQGRAGFEVVGCQPSENQLRVTGRVPPNASSQWIVLANHLLEVAEEAPWKVDISRHYFRRQVASGAKRMFYAWRLIFQAAPIMPHLPSILETVHNAPRPARVELQEHKLTGASRNYSNGKGAFSAETSPMAAYVSNQIRMGGAR